MENPKAANDYLKTPRHFLKTSPRLKENVTAFFKKMAIFLKFLIIFLFFHFLSVIIGKYGQNSNQVLYCFRFSIGKKLTPTYPL